MRKAALLLLESVVVDGTPEGAYDKAAAAEWEKCIQRVSLFSSRLLQKAA